MILNCLKLERFGVSDIVVFASGRGSNFTAIHRTLKNTPYGISALVCDDRQAPVKEYALLNGIPVIDASCKGRAREEVEGEILSKITPLSPRLLVLAGYRRLLTPLLVNSFPSSIINIHPSLLPRHPGMDSIRRSWESEDEYLGISIHYVDEGMDSGEIIVQQAFHRSEVESADEMERRIHALEHFWYPRTIIELLKKDRKPIHKSR